MITEKELIRVNELRGRQRELEALLSGFDNPKYEMNIGLVDLINSDEMRLSGLNNLFHRRMKKFISYINDRTIREIKIELSDIESELKSYIGDAS